ncbi:hypothetical protein KRX52_05170 [Pseudomonas sp. MAP12]|uniref:DUF3829 domain-containing protein n=1 Tax=Geopseudomonas aromaticivorans TaxID=2849492 RepID=A0ABS6MTP6_9GAMM|nr:hypothetical protein [Pseudomonas aromaticivorans]MBV2132188.1 hypothetical protein [Pseudomonas aromaticivorans]
MHLRLLLVLLLMLPGLASASLSAQRLQDIRLEAFAACSNLLAFYNPNQQAADPRHLERYRQGFHGVQQLLAGQGDAALEEAAAEMRSRLEELERVPAGQVELYPDRIIPLLKAHARLDHRAAELYAAAPPAEQRQLTLHRLSLDIERLLLLYQSRAFSMIGMYVLDVDDNTVPQLDGQIHQGFADLAAQWPGHSAELAKLKQNYDFIRPRLLQHDRAWVPGSAAYYLGQVTTRLAQLDAE